MFLKNETDAWESIYIMWEILLGFVPRIYHSLRYIIVMEARQDCDRRLGTAFKGKYYWDLATAPFATGTFANPLIDGNSHYESCLGQSMIMLFYYRLPVVVHYISTGTVL